MKPIQQRRPFFQAVGPLKRQQRFERTQPRARLHLAAVISAALLFCSCASLTPDRVAVLAAIAGQAAQIGAEQWLVKHPTHREAFELVVQAIAALVRAGNTNQAAYVDLLHSLPTSTLAGPEGAVYITEDRLVIRDEATDKSYAATMPMVKAAVSGLKRALAPMPPMPTRRQATNAVLSDAALDAEFQAIVRRMKERTNGVR